MWLDHIKIYRKICDLIENKELPRSAYPQLYYIGHKLRKIIANSYDELEYKCINCKQEWIGYVEHVCNKPQVYITNQSKMAEWECKECGHIWTSEKGWVCPECKERI